MNQWRQKISGLASSSAALGAKPAPGDELASLLQYAVSAHQAGRLAEAEKAYRKVLKRHPKQADCLHLLGVICHQKGAYRDAMRQFDLALKVEPNVAAIHANRAGALLALKRFDEALANCDKAVSLNPDLAEAFNTRGAVLIELKHYEPALASCDKAIALKPGYAGAFNNRGNALKDLKRRDEALESYDRALALNADFPEAHSNRGNILNQLGRHHEALASLERAITLKPDFAEAYFNRGIAFDQLKRHEEALPSYEQAVALKPDYAEAWSNRGAACLALRRYDDAVKCYERAMSLDPDVQYLRGMHLHAKMLVCDWTSFAADRSRLIGAVAAGNAATPPFQLASVSSDPKIMLECARQYVEDRYAPFPEPLWRGERYAHSRIRVAYLSSDFGDHPVARLTVGLFERHDRTRFETTAISYGPDYADPIRDRLKVAFDRFIDAHGKTSDDVARTLRELEIDIVVDLNGLTDGSRPDVMTRRPAPVHVNYLGFPGTLGSDYWDYLIADPFVVPEGSRPHYGENVVQLPDCFMANDSRRRISERTPSRSEAGLPESGFVFCCFNNTYKITPDLFDVWMRLLDRVGASVLWLPAVNATAIANLQREAKRRGVAPQRLVFAPRVPLNEDHLARMRLADLFLDTPYYNAHATAADALWAGIPVLTCAGASFASRVAGSLLHAVGLPELVAASLADYEALALGLAGDPARLAALRKTLGSNRDTHPLFDTARFTQGLEAAYIVMWERTQRGDPPHGFALAAKDRRDEATPAA